MKKLLCIIISLLFCVSFLTVNSFATEISVKHTSHALKTSQNFSVFQKICKREYAKNFYDGVFSSDFSDGTITIFSDSKPLVLNILDKSVPLANDYPEFYFLQFQTENTEFVGTTEKISDGYKSTLYLDTSIDAEKMYQQYIDIYELASQLNFEYKNRYELVKCIHDYLCNTVEYTQTTENCGNCYGALLEGKAKCGGYADAFKFLCNYYDIPCQNLYGTSVQPTKTGTHAWNAVEMDDGKWYYIDVTWDDRKGGPYYDYFLSGTTTLGYHNEEFNSSHILHKNFTDQYYTYQMITPVEVSPEKYEIQSDTLFDFNIDTKVNYNNYTILKLYEDVSQPIYYNGVPVNIPKPFKNLISVTNNNTKNNEIWNVFYICDINEDSKYDISDYGTIVNMLLSDEYSEEADILSDGVIDVLDASLYEKFIKLYSL